ncbi:MAG: peptidase M15 [Muribaculaceae bacterium]|nr:peptidase M15 [Muribaculaceae bacterium]
MKYFTIEELCRSATATLRGIDNTPTEEAKRNLTRLVDDVLDPLRKAWGRPLVVSSGYRCPALNAAVGGSRTSHHMRGMAADIDTGNSVDNRRLYNKVLELGLPFTQLIDEHNFGWVHIGYDPANVKRQQLKL